jgi:hypothetical protein
VSVARQERSRLEQSGTDLIAAGHHYLAHARKYDRRPSAPAEFSAAVRDLAAALGTGDDGVAIVAAIARLVHHGRRPRMFFGAQLHGMVVATKLQAAELSERNRAAASKPRGPRKAKEFEAAMEKEVSRRVKAGEGSTQAHEAVARENDLSSRQLRNRIYRKGKRRQP